MLAQSCRWRKRLKGLQSSGKSDDLAVEWSKRQSGATCILQHGASLPSQLEVLMLSHHNSWCLVFSGATGGWSTRFRTSWALPDGLSWNIAKALFKLNLKPGTLHGKWMRSVFCRMQASLPLSAINAWKTSCWKVLTITISSGSV